MADMTICLLLFFFSPFIQSIEFLFLDIDGMVFIGSANFDPIPANLNSEVGLVVESAMLQERISNALDKYLPLIAYEWNLIHKVKWFG